MHACVFMHAVRAAPSIAFLPFALDIDIDIERESVIVMLLAHSSSSSVYIFLLLCAPQTYKRSVVGI